MAKNNIGGFFVDLVLNPDKNSFETGNKLVDNVGNSLNRIISTAKNVSVVLATTALTSGAIASQEIHTAEAIGTTTEKLNLWKAAAKIAGADASGLVNTISKLGNVMNHMTIDGSGLEAYAEQLGKLEIGFDEIEGMDPADAMQKIIEKAQDKLDGTDETKLRITTIVGDILGDAGQQLFIDLNRQKLTVGEFLNGVSKTQYETSEDMNNAAGFITEVRYVKEEIKSLSKLFGDNIAAELTPMVKDLKDWLLENGPEIADKLRDIAKGMGSLVEKFVGKIEELKNNETVQEAKEVIVDSVKGAAEGTKKMVEGIAEGDLQKTAEGFKEGAAATFSPVTKVVENKKEEYADRIQDNKEAGQNEATAKINAGARTIPIYKGLVHLTDWVSLKTGKMDEEEYQGYWGKQEKKPKKTNDGILRPDGTLTQVAPDDWVFAVRNIGDLARAFIPGQTTGQTNNNEYVINQTFNISNAKDVPQVLKQQAYRGTQEGLQQLMSKSSQRLQMMSGTR